MKAQIVEQIELFSEAELESLKFVPEELEAIEAERVPDLDSISFEDIAGNLEADLENNNTHRLLHNLLRLPQELQFRILEQLSPSELVLLVRRHPQMAALLTAFENHRRNVLRNLFRRRSRR